MEVSMNQLALSSVLSLVLGIALGAVFDIFRFFRVLFGVSVKSPFGKRGIKPYIDWLFTIVSDLLFLSFTAVCLCVFFFLTGDGRMRIYPLAGAFLGFEIYYHTVGRLFIGIVDFLAKSVKNFFYRCFMLVEKISAKIARKFWCLPIVRGIIAWYNEQKSKKKAARAAKRRRKKMKKFGGVKNGF